MPKLTTLEGISSATFDKPVVKYGLIAAVGIGALLVIKHKSNGLSDCGCNMSDRKVYKTSRRKR